LSALLLVEYSELLELNIDNLTASKQNNVRFDLMENPKLGELFNRLSDVVEESGVQAYLIGGYVRDYFLRRPSKDIDVVVLGSGIRLAEKFGSTIGGKVSVFANFGTAMLRYGDIEVEFVGARRESYSRGSRKPVVEDGTLEDDQNRRDFTINALAFSLNKDTFGELVDPFGGLQDLKHGLIRTPLNPDITFSDDPLRMFRAIRFASQLKFKITDDTFEAIGRNKGRMEILSMERVSEELHKMLLSPQPSLGFKLLEESGLLAIIFPQLQALKGVDSIDGKRHKDNFYHTLEVVDNVRKQSDDLWLLWAALLHDIAKPACKRYDTRLGWTFHGHEFLGSKMVPELFKQLKMPLNEKMKYVQKLVLLHLRPIVLSQEEVTDSAIRRLLFDAGDELEDLMLLCEADITSKNEKTVKRHLANFRLARQKLKEIEEKDAIRNFQPPISGELIMETYGLQPSREVGLIKDAIKDAILDGVIRIDYDEAYRFMEQKAEELGLSKRQ
jgi:poly(A) polymerase